MITPGTYHRIVEGGRDSGAFHKVTSIIADLSLLPFALALGIDVFVSIEHVFGSPTALAVALMRREAPARRAQPKASGQRS